MGRPKTFEEDEVLQRAMMQFWETGYSALSVKDLEQGTGLLRGSLYAAFGDKRALFLAALERYADLSAEELETLLASGPTPRAGIERYLRNMLKNCTGELRHRGCLLANTAAEVAPRDPEVRALVGRRYSKMAAILETAIKASQDAGEIDPARNARALAQHLIVLVQGMSLVGKTEPEAPLVRSALRMALTLLDSKEQEDLE
ncbi:TetR/AcrR family transcriptional regulator [Pyxidicoccus xibeiensis]|uniref:TetR/AcrR family transcriptional regulator n=1 Tax=Pyxidicoccus xibeiensis TaxID=2906759 RepID=UPI0020A7E18E|nr:TetR/AcrR family transcriptional regulator [Pyxidicoccus xibeiensis]MCP3138062.1 TetR/AcrR family transcriptional regulator [Pyxidicoccus xibeiensis]